MCSSFARQAAALATLSVFMVPMTAEFGWSRVEMSAAVSLGNIIAALASPLIGRVVDRIGARAVLVWSAVLISATAVALAFTDSLLWFYIFLSLARMLFASPFDIAITAVAANWFVRRRAQAMAMITLAAAASLALMPVIAQLAINSGGWRTGWIAIAIAALTVGVLPNLLLMVRRPEDLGLLPDGDLPPPQTDRVADSAGDNKPCVVEPGFTLAQARRSPALWLLMAFTSLIFVVQSGISLHQAPVMIAQGIDATAAASVIGLFAIVAAASGFAVGWLGPRVPVRVGLAGAALLVAAGAMLTADVKTLADGYLSASVYGMGIGALMTFVPVAFADYFGRAHYGAIRGLALPAQVLGQAVGPIIAGGLFDTSGSYRLAMWVFATIAIVAALLVLVARPPRAPQEQ
jgi:OFA family oxalate/formate antiporter-like MFS transporter